MTRSNIEYVNIRGEPIFALLQAKQKLCLEDMSEKSSELLQNCVCNIILHYTSEWKRVLFILDPLQLQTMYVRNANQTLGIRL